MTVKLRRGAVGSASKLSIFAPTPHSEIQKETDCDPIFFRATEKQEPNTIARCRTKQTCCRLSNTICDGGSEFTCNAPAWFEMDSSCYQCSSAMEHCLTCNGNNKCLTCEAPYVLADNAKSCVEAPTCASQVLKDNANVAVATDAASFYEALSSSKSIILVEESISGLTTANLGSKKLVGPKYFSSVSLCSSKTTPTITFASNATMTISGGEINQLNLKFPFDDILLKDAVSGSGTIKDANIISGAAESVVTATGKITLAGNVTLTADKLNGSEDNTENVLITRGGSVEITGKTTLNGTANRGLWIRESTTATIASSGSLILNIPGLLTGIAMDDNSIFTANGPVKFDAPARYAFNNTTIKGKTVINLNAAGNYIKIKYYGLIQTHGDFNIKGSTTIEYIHDCEICGCSAIYSNEVYSSSVNSVTISAPVTLVNFKKSQDLKYENMILYFVGGTLKINSTIESKTGYGSVLINGETMSMSSSGAILGASYLYGNGNGFSVSAGAKLKMGGTCKNAASSGTLSTVTYDNGITSPVSPFTGGC